jgi:adenosylmethionine-8-amino-7-oxononanoate aminotransferase
MALDTESLRRLDKQYLWHPFTHMRQWMADDPLVITHADGMYLYDSDGRKYLDGVSSLWCNVHGHRVPEIDEAVRAQIGRVAHSTLLGLSNEPAILLAERLMKIVPPGLAKIFYSDSGATATEIAFKLAAQYWHNLGQGQKSEFVGFADAYHGDTVGAMSVGRMEFFHRPYFPMLFKVHFAPSPHVYRSATPSDPAAVARDCLKSLQKIFEANASRIAAVGIEPLVQGAGGMIAQPPGFLAGVRSLCNQHHVLLIADEVATGFGRTAKMFACEHENISPDLLCVAKGITGGYLPLAATFATQKIFDAFLGEPWEGKTFFHGHTYTGNPLSCAAALASLDLFEKTDLLQAVQRKEIELSRLLQGLKTLDFTGDIRQKGFMVGIELVRNKENRESFDPRLRIGAAVCARIRKHGVIIRPLGDVLVLMPPLAMPIENLRTIVDALHTEISAISP